MDIPKALIKITDEPCLTTTLRQIGKKFDQVFVVVNQMVKNIWNDYQKELELTEPDLLKNVEFVYISSGLGDGHATLQAIDATEAKDVIVMWGDVFLTDPRLIDELLKIESPTGIIPVVHENNPYVTILVDDKMKCTSADFSKHGEKHPAGFHDQSVFKFNRDVLSKALHQLHCSLWKGNRYMTPTGELSLLYSFHHCYNTHWPLRVYETNYSTVSFNTLEEVAALQQKIIKESKMLQALKNA
jgi:bifunctional N-acetylglucosamine-1-phosphate-uridyltransferase/glucosamine-1-phosphate-acetyltransferase GlmU-like protein